MDISYTSRSVLFVVSESKNYFQKKCLARGKGTYSVKLCFLFDA